MALTDQAIDKIKAMIVSGELPPGSRLPKEGELALQLGLSRSSLREAVRALTAMQILVTRQGDGTYVSDLEPQRLLENLSFVSDVSRGATALHLLQVRRLLEPQAAALAATRATEEDLAALRRILDEATAAGDVEEFIRCDIDFHRAIADLVANPVLSAILDMLSTQTQRVRILRGTEAAQAIDHAHREHEAILAALRDGDAQLAAAAAAVHVAALERWVRDAGGH
ncbi:FadR/GntR family transcriptional regulator [Streptacidiphilus jiangxiensis]|uniref:DNA-binding transcriptional regulator, FadR family n=1 Tax=Streptacidiphilus jiangxiensis TaxID=235985 RepID=A0A1H7WCX8_STRJI|nr:FadR/GntR family transcriptional regulator [Streptacidiphilus jiangxiensis]SEM19373.1 DNA-binding transcriptional regulator, FadR family [Streptacidiphilus jiangxiensis]